MYLYSDNDLSMWFIRLDALCLYNDRNYKSMISDKSPYFCYEFEDLIHQYRNPKSNSISLSSANCYFISYQFVPNRIEAERALAICLIASCAGLHADRLDEC